MATQKITAGELREELARRGAKWTVDPNLRDSDPLPDRALGGLPPTPQAELPRIDFTKIANRLKASGGKQASPEMSLPTKVDWRNNLGYNWITKARNQNPCDICWAFASTALVESMTRVEHCVWSQRSEGDVLWSAGANCQNSGNFELGLNAIAAHGIADPACTPFVNAVTTYNPLPDREGRTVKISGFQTITNIQDQKQWLAQVGPLGSPFYVWRDFAYGYGHGTEVYIWDSTQHGLKSNPPGNDEMGWHALLIVGYDDTLQAWIAKNSWGPDWGFESGYAYIGYGQTEIDSQARYAVHQTNPDPWTKRRMHAGGLLESDLGNNHNDLEAVTVFGTGLRHWQRDDQHNWHSPFTFGEDLAETAVALIQSTWFRNRELVYLSSQGGKLHHWWYDVVKMAWLDGGLFGPGDLDGVPGLIQGNYNAPGNLEAIARTTGKQLCHLWKVGTQWKTGVRFGSNVLSSGPAFIQSDYGLKGDFELVCVAAGGVMQHWKRQNDVSGNPWVLVESFGKGVVGPPCMIQSQFNMDTEDMHGNFELCIASEGSAQHWWRDNKAGNTWQQSATFGSNVRMVLGLTQSSFLFNLEVLILTNDSKIQHYWRQGSTWLAGPVLGTALP